MNNKTKNITFICEHCKSEIKPTIFEIIVLFILGSPTKRYLKCPNCNKKTWFI